MKCATTIMYVLWFVVFVLIWCAVGMKVVNAQPIYINEVKGKQAVYVQELYEVENGDNLNKIAIHYMNKNTYGKRELNEFKSGIIELNPWLLERELKTGDIVDVRYWRKKDD